MALGCALAPAPSWARPQEPDHDRPGASERVSPSPISTSLEKRAEGKASADDVRIDVQWRRKTGMMSVRIYGNGVGIWTDTTQFSLTHNQIVALLKAFEKAQFGAMPPHYGSDEEGETDSENEGPKEKTYFLGIISLRIGTDSKSVAQTMSGEQSAAFRKLGEQVLTVAEKAAKSRGVTAKSLPDALDKLVSGKLAPETLQLLANRRTDRPGPGEEDGEWILRMDGRRVADRSGANEKASVARVLMLSSADFHAFAETLRANDPDDFPRNIYSPQYLRVDVRVLSGHRDITARRYSGTNAETHGDKQKAFDRVYAALLALHLRAVKEGRTANAQ